MQLKTIFPHKVVINILKGIDILKGIEIEQYATSRIYWCEANAGMGRYASHTRTDFSNFSTCMWVYQYDGGLFDVFYFKDRDIAVMFKLIYG